ncbi:unnamed protein product [Peniophora sp. CBMAI 1063]|nr:unnamed protein product [Peniophora sp. CBMAI 1063]
MEALNMHFELLVAEKDFTMAEVERLREEEHSLEDNPNLCHVRDALIQCATEYNQLDEKIEEDMQVALVDVQVLSGDVRKVTKDLRKLQKSIDAVETTRKIILSSFEQFFEEANAMIRDWKAEQSLQSSDTRATNN